MSAYNSKAKLFQLSDGRELAYDEYGDPQGHPTCYFHGGPGSRLEGALFHEGGLKHSLRIMAVDRPGMGGSDFLPGRTMLDFPKDVAALGEHLSKTIPNAIFHKLPDEGHFFPVTHMDEIMEVATSAMTIK